MKCSECGLYVHWLNLCCNNCGFSKDYNESVTCDPMIEITKYPWVVPNRKEQ